MLPRLSGETRIHLIVGDPVGQTKSPAGLTRVFTERGVDAVCIPMQVAAADLDVFMEAAKRVHNIDGIVVTVPHKFAALRHCDAPSARARALAAVNAMRREPDGRWSGDMTDGVAVHDIDAARRDDLRRRLVGWDIAAGGSDPAGHGLIVNATPLGMAAGDPLPIDVGRLEPGAWVADLVTRPAVTPLLAAAGRGGSPTVTGAQMFAPQ